MGAAHVRRVHDDLGRRQPARDRRPLRRADARRGLAQRADRRDRARAARHRRVGHRLPQLRGRDRRPDRGLYRGGAGRAPAARVGLRHRARAVGDPDRADRHLSARADRPDPARHRRGRDDPGRRLRDHAAAAIGAGRGVVAGDGRRAERVRRHARPRCDPRACAHRLARHARCADRDGGAPSGARRVPVATALGDGRGRSRAPARAAPPRPALPPAAVAHVGAARVEADPDARVGGRDRLPRGRPGRPLLHRGLGRGRRLDRRRAGEPARPRAVTSARSRCCATCRARRR